VPGPAGAGAPALRIVSANVTSLRRHGPHLWGRGAGAEGPQVLLLQEARVPGPAQAAVAADARRSGYRLLWGAPGPDGGALVAAAVRGGAWRQLPVEAEVPEPHRLLHLAFFAGGVAVHLFSVYAPADGTAAARATCVALCEAALAAAEALGPVPALLVGDFNQDPLPEEIAALLHLGGWVDAGAGEAAATCHGAGARRGSRVDRALLNPPAARLLAGFRVDWTLGLPTHAALCLDLQVGRPPPYPARVRPPSLAGPSAPGWAPEQGVARLRRDWEPRWTVALARDDVDAAWGALSAGVGSYLAERQGQAEGTLPPRPVEPGPKLGWPSLRPRPLASA